MQNGQLQRERGSNTILEFCIILKWSANKCTQKWNVMATSTTPVKCSDFPQAEKALNEQEKGKIRIFVSWQKTDKQSDIWFQFIAGWEWAACRSITNFSIFHKAFAARKKGVHNEVKLLLLLSDHFQSCIMCSQNIIKNYHYLNLPKRQQFILFYFIGELINM